MAQITGQLPTYMEPLKYNILADADSYKFGMWRLYRKGTTTVYSYIESRGGRYPAVMFAGLQPLLYEKLGQKITHEMIDELAIDLPKHGVVFDEAGWRKVVNVYGGKLPLLIRAVDEGTVVPVRNALFSVENLDPELFWLTTYFETMILRDLWTACTIATRIFYMSGRIQKHWDETSDNPMSPFAFLDFCSRGVMGQDHSKLAAIAHLFHFMGSDNYIGIRHVNKYYFEDMAGFSVYATEHSISCGFGYGNDDEYIQAELDQVPAGTAEKPTIVSLVGDTWDIFKFVEKVAKYKDILERKYLLLVVRPDSGELREVLPILFPSLVSGFGSRTNSKGMEVLNLGVKLLQGDGMNEVTHMLPFTIAKEHKVAPDSVMTAAGGGLATGDLDRDTNRWAMKASEHVINGVHTPIRKDPITDQGKASKAGRFALIADSDGGYQTVNINFGEELAGDLLKPRFISGSVVNAHRLVEIRARVSAQVARQSLVA